MNKTFYGLCLVLMAGTAAFTACIRMPDRPRPEAEGDPLTYRFDGGADMTSLFDLEARYVASDGRTAIERIASLPWSKQLAVKRPFGARLDVTFRKKASYPVRDTYAVGWTGGIDFARSKAAIPPPRSVTSSPASEQSIRLRVTLPEGASADDLTLRFAPLKYDKHFAFTLTCDDSNVTAYSRIWKLIHAKWIDDRVFSHLDAVPTTGYLPARPLAMTDGCGNLRRFGFSCAIWSTLGNDYNPTFVKDLSATGANSMYLAWEELRLMADFGVSMLFHNVDERLYDKTDPVQIARGFRDDYDKAYEKLGLRMKVLGLPDGNAAYAEAAAQSDLVRFTRNSLRSSKRIRLHACGDLTKGETYGGDNTSDVTRKLAELAAEAASDDPYWVGITVHRAGEEHVGMLEEIYRLYGAAGSDALWVASWDEIYEYVALREGARIRKSTQGHTVDFEIDLPPEPDFLFREISLLVEGGGSDCAVEPLSDGIVGMTSAAHGKGMLVNVNFNPRLPALAERYTARYEREMTDEALVDARYFISQLLPALAAPFEARLGAVVAPSQGRIDVGRVEAYRTQLDGFKTTVACDFEAE